MQCRAECGYPLARWMPAGVATVALIVVPAAMAGLQAGVFEHGQTVGWLGIGPLLASLALSWRRVAAVAAYTLLVAAALVILRPGASTEADGVRLAVVVALGIFAVVNCFLRERREFQLMQVAEVARVAERAILKPVPSTAGTWALASAYRSAARAAHIGGDVLEVIETPSGARAIIGDVCGKGLPAVDLATTVLMTFREVCAQPGTSLVEVARRLDDAVVQQAGHDTFVTAVLVDFDDRGWLHVVNCGHPPPLRMTAAGDLQPLSPSVGTCPLAMRPSPKSDTYYMGPGDRVLLYTDGLLEARNREGEFFSIDEHGHLLRDADLNHGLERLLAVAERHAGGRIDDDVALLLASARSHAGGPKETLLVSRRSMDNTAR